MGPSGPTPPASPQRRSTAGRFVGLLSLVGLCLLFTGHRVAQSQGRPTSASTDAPELSIPQWGLNAPSGESDGTGVGLFLARKRPDIGYLRGDHEANNLLLLVWQPEWEGAVKRLAAAAAQEMEVQILVPRGAWAASRPLRRWAKRKCVDISFQSYDTAWIRDYGPLQFVQQGQITWGDFTYDSARPEDDAFPKQLASDLEMPIARLSERLDGGGLVSNGHGLCVMTDASVEESLADSSHRHPSDLASALGCRALAVIGALPDEQTGHADVSVQFLSHDLVAVAQMDGRQAPLQALLLDQAAMLIQDTAARLGQTLRVIRVPMMHRGEVFYSYINAVRGRTSLFVPSYREVPAELEQQAHAALAGALPELRIVPVRSDAIVGYGGALHCITLGLNIPDNRQVASATCRRAKLSRKRIKQRPARRRTGTRPRHRRKA